MDKLWLAPHGLHIELAEPTDAEALVPLHAAGFYRGWTREEFQTFLDDPATPVFLACDARRRIAGFAVIRLVADEAELLTIVVDKRWRGKGIGKALLQAVLADLQVSPARRMFLEVEGENAAALRLYRRFGFATVGERKGYYPRPDGTAATALVMARDLG